VTDSDFNQAHDIGTVAGELKLIQARTHAWALCYFLLKDRPAGVIKLYQEFSSMPRDLDLEPKQMLACFCRAFDVADDTRTKMDPAKFEELGKKWLGFMA